MGDGRPNYEALHDQMMRWGAERDGLRDALREQEKRAAKLEAENGRLRAAIVLIHERAASAIKASGGQGDG